MEKILGMGNALTDILLCVSDDAPLNQLELPKGSMQLIDEVKMHEISELLSHIPAVMATGGSASNTINGITKLGIPAGFLGKLGKDAVGDFFMNDSIENGVTPQMTYSETPSGRCTVLITPDGERTLCTFLGAACELYAEDLNLEMFSDYTFFHIEGYLVQNHDLIKRAVQLAKEAGLTVSLDLASFNVVETNLDFLHDLIENYVDIVFANEEEAKSFTNKSPEEALELISKKCKIAVVKTGKTGSLIKSGEVTHKVGSRVSDCIDTTGAGDLYASGFLYGLAKNFSLDVCGAIGSIVAGHVVEVIGAKMPNEKWETIHSEIKKVLEMSGN